jgi:hypothetical protein
MSTGKKVLIAFGIVCAVAGIAVLIYMLTRKKDKNLKDGTYKASILGASLSVKVKNMEIVLDGVPKLLLGSLSTDKASVSLGKIDWDKSYKPFEDVNFTMKLEFVSERKFKCVITMPPIPLLNPDGKSTVEFSHDESQK